MNVLSLFDGMSCGQIALKRANIKVDNYFASEVDEYAMKVTNKNYPNTIQLGDVTKLNVSDLPKIDLLMGGSPCQGFSVMGQQLNFEDARSKLFFEYAKILKTLKAINPKMKFLLENVKMKKEYQDVISSYIFCEPKELFSGLVSAQARKRLYWTNIEYDANIKDKKLIIRDILEKNVDEKYFFNKERIEKFESTIIDNPKKSMNGIIQLNKPNYSQQRVYSIDGKSPTLSAGNLGGGKEPCKIRLDDGKYRKATPIECERLQTIEDNYTDCVSDSQRYKMIGNGWTVDIIAHILKGLEKC